MLNEIYKKLDFSPSKNELEYSKAVAENLSSKEKQSFFMAEIEAENANLYLVPAMLHATKTNERVLITISSKIKLKEILEKNIPLILPLLDKKICSTVLKERFNYACLRKFYNCVNNAELYLTLEERSIFFAVITWIEKTKDGDLNEVLHYSRSPVLWKKIACEPASCLGAECEHFSKCFFCNAKKNADNSNLLLVHHNLFLQNMNTDFVLLPNSEKIIIDNASSLPSKSQKTFGKQLYFYILRNVIKQNIWCKKWEEKAQECEKLYLSLMKEIQNYSVSIKKRKIIYEQNFSTETGISSEKLQSALRELLNIIEQTSSEFYSQNELGKAKDCMQFASDLRKILSDLIFFFAANKKEFVYFVECLPNVHQITFNAELVNTSLKFKNLYSNLKSVFFTSKVMSINTHFDYLISRFALFGKNPKTKIFNTKKPEEYPEVFAADFLPKPSEEKFLDELTKTLCEIISKNVNNTLIFTDMSSILKLSAEFKNNESLQNKTCFFQGSDGNFFNLSGFFQKAEGSILVGTPEELKSLEEMDLPENTLIVIARLPFPDLKEPVVAKQMELLKEQNKNGFMFITMPETSLTLRNTYSTILKSGKKQTLLLLDSRMISEPYGTKIQKLFPNLKILSHRIFSTSFFAKEQS